MVVAAADDDDAVVMGERQEGEQVGQRRCPAYLAHTEGPSTGCAADVHGFAAAALVKAVVASAHLALFLHMSDTLHAVACVAATERLRVWQQSVTPKLQVG